MNSKLGVGYELNVYVPTHSYTEAFPPTIRLSLEVEPLRKYLRLKTILKMRPDL